jgi:archaellum component FlaC
LNSTMSEIYDQIAEQIKGALQDVVEGINSKLESVSDDLSGAFGKLGNFTTTITGLEGNINDLFADVSKTLTDQIDAVKENLSTSINTMMSGYVTTLNSYISQINNVISNVTSLISDPNSKLQPVLLYTTSSGASSYLSTSATLPTSVKVSGSGKQGVTFVATSYTGELLAPAYKKYIAVVNVTDPDGNSAQGGNATCQKAADVANQEAQTNFNTVLDGGKRGVVFTTSDAYVGYTYEIAYAAVDYSGNMVARRFYVKVTK